MFTYYGEASIKKGTGCGVMRAMQFERPVPDRLRSGQGNIPAAGVLVLGPLYGLLFVCLLPLLLLTALLFMPRIAAAMDTAVNDESAQCLKCHEMLSHEKTLANGEALRLHITGRQFRGSVHQFVPCTGCHSDISLGSHQRSQFESRHAFALEVSRACSSCHSDDQFQAKTVHRNVATRPHAPPCSACHGSHAIRKVPGWKASSTATQYCLTCHSKNINTSVNETNISLTISTKLLRSSVHSSHACTDCHTSFSRDDHPTRRYGGIRERSVSISNLCQRCHLDKAEKVQGSIHASLLNEGNLKAPVCTDCHGSHAVHPTKRAAAMNDVSCRRCHEESFKAYTESVHGRARANGSEAAPLCASCHFAHEVMPAMASRSPAAACTGCHADAAEVHAEWLPNAGLHLESVACTACHVPGAERSVYLRVTDGMTGRNIRREQVQESLGDDYTLLDRSRKAGNGIAGRELWGMYRKLNDENVQVRLDGSLGLRECRQSHRLAAKHSAVRECEVCHSAGSPFFQSVSLVTVSAAGREERYPVNRAVLGSLYSFVPLNQFYALGSTRVRALDVIGIFMLLAGMVVPWVHSAIMIMTAPRREARKADRHRKEGGR